MGGEFYFYTVFGKPEFKCKYLASGHLYKGSVLEPILRAGSGFHPEGKKRLPTKKIGNNEHFMAVKLLGFLFG